jgi:hypothetical protein
MADWNFVLASRTGAALVDLSVVPTLRFEENRPSTVTFALPHDLDDASVLYDELQNGLPQLRAYRDGVLRFSGRFSPLEEATSQDQSEATVVFKSPLAGLEQRFLEVPLGPYVAADQGTIAWELILNENNTKGATGLTLGTITPTTARDRTYGAGKQVLEALVQLSEVIGGVYFWEAPLDPTTNSGALASFNAGPRQGTDLSADITFQVGFGTLDNCLTASRQIGLPVNRATVYGGGDTPPFYIAEDAGSKATYGVWEVWETLSDVTELATVTARAQELLKPSPPQTVTFEPDPAEAPEPWIEWWLGDTVSFKADRDAFQVITTARPHALEVKLDDQGNEVSWSVEWGDQRPVRFPELFRAMRRRLSALEAPP